MKQQRISLVAPSGTGKSTVAGMMRDIFERSGRTVEILKLAAPLYQLQADVYRECGVIMRPNQQDQHLLEVIATEMRRISSESLVHNFSNRLAATDCDIVLNDDLRDNQTDWPWLKKNGFTVIRVIADKSLCNKRLQSRGDLTLVNNSPLNVQISRIKEDYTLINDGSLDMLYAQVEALVASLA